MAILLVENLKYGSYYVKMNIVNIYNIYEKRIAQVCVLHGHLCASRQSSGHIQRKLKNRVFTGFFCSVRNLRHILVILLEKRFHDERERSPFESKFT